MAATLLEPRHLAGILTSDFVELSPVQILENRLIEGERRIAQAEARGEDTTRLVDFWIELLHQYEDACAPLSQAA
jgi:hypothetical protein